MNKDTYLTPKLIIWRAKTDILFMLIAIGTIPILLLDLIRNRLSYADKIFLDIVNIIVLIAFAIDFIVEIKVCIKRKEYLKNEWASLLIVISQALTLLPSLTMFGLLRGVRAIRVLITIIRAIAIGSAAKHDGKNILREHAAGFAFSIAGFTWITSAVAFTIAEDVGVNGRLHSFFDSLWWSSTTMTTVGYGDIYPVTAIGRIVAVFTMVVGISTFAVVTAKVAEFLLRKQEVS